MTEDGGRPTTTSAEELLRVHAVAKSFGDVSVLEEITFTLESGELSAVVGPNGSGKTTLLRVLAGSLTPNDGIVEFCQSEVDRAVGYLPQEPRFRPSFTARETLDFYATLVNGDAGGALERVGLTDAADRRVEALSGGMTRLLGLAQATIGDPPVYLLDEPVSGLDPTMRRRTFRIARELADDGAAVLLASHDLSLVEKYSDGLFVLDGGTVAAAGSPASICEERGVETLDAAFDAVVDRPDVGVAVLGVTDE